jgi:hypothetical protein
MFPGFLLGNFEYLPIGGDGTTDDAQDGKDRNEQAAATYPTVQIAPHEKTKNNAARHGQTQLHDNRHRLSPSLILLKIEYVSFFSGHTFHNQYSNNPIPKADLLRVVNQQF